LKIKKIMKINKKKEKQEKKVNPYLVAKKVVVAQDKKK
jgi:hypothetical protein